MNACTDLSDRHGWHLGWVPAADVARLQTWMRPPPTGQVDERRRRPVPEFDAPRPAVGHSPRRQPIAGLKDERLDPVRGPQVLPQRPPRPSASELRGAGPAVAPPRAAEPALTSALVAKAVEDDDGPAHGDRSHERIGCPATDP